MTRTRTFEIVLVAAWMLGLACTLGGCSSGGGKADAGPAYDQLYSKGQYAAAYEEASKVATSLGGKDKARAALVAGLSAYALDRDADAEKWLRPLLTSGDPQVAGESGATLGLILQDQGRHAQAAEMLSGAAKKLTGDQGARAAMYAGDSFRAQGQKDQAEAMFALAKQKAEQDTALKVMINDRLAGKAPTPRTRTTTLPSTAGASGRPTLGTPAGAFTVQVGAFSSAALAQKEAEKYRRYGSPQIVPITSRDGKALHAVRIGAFASKAQAEELRRSIGASARVVQVGS